MTEKSEQGILERLQDQVEALDSTVGRVLQRTAETEERFDDFTTQVAARLEAMQIRQAEERDYPDRTLPADLPPQYVAGRWKQRDGNVYGRYTYEEGTAGQRDPQLRRSPPATD